MIESHQNIAMIREAIKTNKPDDLDKIFSIFPDLKLIDTPFGTWLHVAASCGALEAVKYLISLGLDPNKKGGTFGGNSLNTATSAGHLNVVDYLLSLKVMIDTSEPERNPLFGAILKGNLPIVKRLIEHGINFRQRYDGEYMQNMDAEAFALEQGQIEIANYLNTLK